MKTRVEIDNYNTKLEASDWRFSAAIYGLIQYFTYHDIEFKEDYNNDCILYNSEDITEERYLKFVENRYKEEFHLKDIENILSKEELSDEDIKVVNTKLSANTIMKKIKANKENKKEILDLIDKNRNEIIKETFSNMYDNYANKYQLFNGKQKFCRLLGYCIDVGRKGKSTGFNFNTNSFVGQDDIEMDFVIFSFNGDRESFFINDNSTIENIEKTNNSFKSKILNDLKDLNKETKIKRPRYSLFKGIIESSDFINRDVEVIIKNRDNGYFETLYLRKESIDIFKNFTKCNISYKDLCTSHKVTDKYYIDIEKVVTDSIVNNIYLDNLIETLLKADRGLLVSQLIKVNQLIRGGKNMNEKLKGAYKCAKQVSAFMKEKKLENKIDTYKQKLTSAIIFKDYDRVYQILLQLSNYVDIEFGFVYDLYDDFEENKDLVYTFINALSKKPNKELNNNKEMKENE